MTHDDLPTRWKSKVSEWIEAHGGDSRDLFSAADFPISQRLKMDFEDGSSVSFRYAISIEAPEWGEVGVFTEHCGYHLFPIGGVLVSFVNE
jgi:hypothetical protein